MDVNTKSYSLSYPESTTEEMPHDSPLKRCFRPPIEEILNAQRHLDEAVSAHIAGDRASAARLFMLANDPKIWEWTDSIWGKKSKYVTVQKVGLAVPAEKVPARMPTAAQIRELHLRDGFHCRFCGLPVIRPKIRRLLAGMYPESVPWGKTNQSQHAAFQAMWAQYDHVVPHSHSGTNDLNNLIVTCAACNYGKMSYTLEELGLADPRLFAPIRSSWDGLERLISS